MIITRENIKEEASNLNDEILNLEKKYGVNIIALAQVESLDTEEASNYLVMANRVSLNRCVNSVVQLVCSAQEGFGIKPEMFFAEAIKRTVGNERVFYDADEEVPPENIDEARREAIINKLKELEEFLEPEGAHFVLHLFTSRDVTEESYSLYNNCSLKILAMSQARIENYIEQLGKISLKHHKENVELMKLVDKLIESIQSGKELSTELEGDMIELLKALKAERNDAGSKKNLYN